ncbi:MAG: hypothetical protein V7784_19290 [Oceanospirillaceae bacterium]
MKEFKPKDGDLLFLPSTDYYYGLEILKFYKNTKTPANLHLRFIGVLENGRFSKRASKTEILKLIKHLKDDFRIKISAETERYATYIKNITGARVEVTRYPLTIRKKNDSNKAVTGPLIVSCPGASREDKGSFDTIPIVNSIFATCGEKVVVNVQGFRKGDLAWEKDAMFLAKRHPTLRLLAPRVSRSDFERYILDADIILLPYNPSSYWYRGSAIFFESIEQGKYMIGRGGNAFVDDLADNNIIDRFYKIDQLGAMMESLSLKPKSYFKEEGEARLERYLSMYDSVNIG